MTGITALLAGVVRRLEALQVAATEPYNFGIAPGLVTSDTPGTSVTGGLAPYTFNWTYVSGEPGFSISSTTEQNPTWSFFFDTPSIVSAVWRVTVNDSAGSAPVTLDITITLSTL